MSGKFRTRFLDQKIQDNVHIEHYRPYFEDYSPEYWASETNGGNFDYCTPDGKNYQCVVTHSSNHGIIVHLYIYLRKKYVDGWITVGNIDRINERYDVGSDEIFYVGNFVTPHEAWEIVIDYLKNPTELPSSKILVNFSDLPEEHEKLF